MGAFLGEDRRRQSPPPGTRRRASQVSIFSPCSRCTSTARPSAAGSATWPTTREVPAAFDDKASLANEQNGVTIEDGGGGTVLFKQIADLIARRIVFNKKVSDTVAAGARRMIKFGGRVDIFCRGVSARAEGRPRGRRPSPIGSVREPGRRPCHFRPPVAATTFSRPATVRRLLVDREDAPRQYDERHLIGWAILLDMLAAASRATGTTAKFGGELDAWRM